MSDGDVKQIFVDGIKVGLFGLEEIFNQIKGKRIKDESKLKELILTEVGKRNYIPSSFREKYGNALLEEYRLFLGEIKERRESGPLTIRVIGPGCYNCERLFELTLQVISEMGISADLGKLTDPADKAKFGITATPALIVNNQVKVVGRVPTKEEIKKWIKDAVN